jgi:hypothetical protein
VKRLTFRELLTAPIPKTIITEPIDEPIIDDEPIVETPTERALRIWFKHGEEEAKP